ncbi:MAG: efflux RND transporter periplasmic adaptor subunit, partial [Microgenomates group bacterium]
MKKIIDKIKNRKKIIVVLLISFLVVFYLFFKNKSQKKENYQTARVEKETLIESVTASGQIISSSSNIVSTLATGVIKNIFAKNGNYVKKGDKILEIELDQIGQQKYQSALANYLSAKNNLDNAQIALYSLQADMFEKWKNFYDLATSSTYQNEDGTPNEANRQLPEFLIAKNNWLAAEAKYKNQQQQISQAQASLSSAWLTYQLSSPIITAPTSGKISDLIYDVGMIIGNSDTSSNNNSGTKIATIKNESYVFGKFTVSEIDVSKIKPGQKATITLDALPNKTFTGEVIAIDKTGEISSSVVSFPLTIKFDDVAKEVLPNMSATANIIVDKKNDVLAVPNSAIVKQNDLSYVRVLKNNQLIMIPVEIGLVSDTK